MHELSLYWTGTIGNIPAAEATNNQNNSAGDSEFMSPEAAGNERKNKFGGK